MDRQPLTARSRKTRRALLHAFAQLIQRIRYEDLQVADLTALAGISRSTFYAHYAGMDALFADSIAGPFAVLADTLQATFDEKGLVALLDHFWGNRAVARGVLVGAARRKATEVLIRLIEDRLKSGRLHGRGSLILPRRLVAVPLAEILLAPITAWLLGESRCSSDTLARGLRRMSVAALDSMLA